MSLRREANKQYTCAGMLLPLQAAAPKGPRGVIQFVLPRQSNQLQLLGTYEQACQSRRGSISRCSSLSSISPEGSVSVYLSKVATQAENKHLWQQRGDRCEYPGDRRVKVNPVSCCSARFTSFFLFIENGQRSTSRDNVSGLIWNQASVVSQIDRTIRRL